MQLISRFDKGFRFFLCVIDIYSKYAYAVPLVDKKGVSIVNTFQKILDDSKRKSNKIWVDKGSELYNRSIKSWLQDNDIAMYSTHNTDKTVVAERFIRTIKNKLYKYMTSISKNEYIDNLDDIVDEYNNTNHRTIKMKPIDIKDNTYNNIYKFNDKDPKLKVVDHVRLLKYKNIFAKGYAPNWSEEIFVIEKIQFHGQIVGTFYKKELQKIDQLEFIIEKVIKKRETSYISNRKDMVVHLIAGLIKKT